MSDINPPEDAATVKLGDEIVDTMRKLFKTPQNYRPVHAKGQLLKGYFTPNKDASKLSKAPIFTHDTTPLIMRVSMDSGLKDMPENGENGSRGFAIRFLLSNDKHFDLITNNAFGFIVGTGEDFLGQFVAQQNGTFDKWLAERPHAKYFQENQAPAHAYSFATEQWHSVQAFKFVNAEGKERFFRWRLVPWQGVMKYSKEDAKKQGKHYQYDDLEWRLSHNKPIKYRLLAQLAEPGDVTNDSTKVWAETNDFAEMGEIVIDKLWTMDDGDGLAQKKIVYNPYPREIEGIEAGDDPLIALREAAYLQSAKIRRDHLDEEVIQAIK